MRRLIIREIEGRYQGSMLGRWWTVVTPIMTLAVYTFVFSIVFKSSWGASAGAGHLNVAVNLFAGLIAFNLFAESLNAAPSLITGRPSYVTKIIFPLEILSVVSVSASVFHALVSMAILVVFQAVFAHQLSLAIVWLPLVWLPLVLGAIALSWLLAALGVFFRDLSQITSVFTGLLMFLSAVFYPLSSLPAGIQSVMRLNPVALAVEQTRVVVVQGGYPDKTYLLYGILASFMACEFCLRFFLRSRRAFADVL